MSTGTTSFRNSKEHVDSVCRALEERVQEKFQGVDRTVGDVNLRLQGMEAKVERLEGLLKGVGGPPAGTDLDEKAEKHIGVLRLASGHPKEGDHRRGGGGAGKTLLAQSHRPAPFYDWAEAEHRSSPFRTPAW